MSVVSVVIPAYNAAQDLEKALDSVRNQTAKVSFEILVVDDGSLDATADVVVNYQQKYPDFNLQYFYQRNKGVSEARNLGLEKATGERIALLDSDDEWLSHKIQRQLEIFKAFPEIDLLGTARNDNPIKWPYKANADKLSEVTLKKLLIRNELQPSTVLFKKSVYENTGGFEIGRRYAEDVDYWMRATKYNKLYVLDESLVIAGGGKRSFGVSGLSANLKGMQEGFLKNIKKLYLEQRITSLEYYFYSFFQRMKYRLLQIRSLF